MPPHLSPYRLSYPPTYVEIHGNMGVVMLPRSIRKVGPDSPCSPCSAPAPSHLTINSATYWLEPHTITSTCFFAPSNHFSSTQNIKKGAMYIR